MILGEGAFEWELGHEDKTTMNQWMEFVSLYKSLLHPAHPFHHVATWEASTQQQYHHWWTRKCTLPNTESAATLKLGFPVIDTRRNSLLLFISSPAYGISVIVA